MISIESPRKKARTGKSKYVRIKKKKKELYFTIVFRIKVTRTLDQHLADKRAGKSRSASVRRLDRGRDKRRSGSRRAVA